ncbi:MAG: hypothetical protein Q9227_000791 [Pyrenula ochraceoflavens]
MSQSWDAQKSLPASTVPKAPAPGTGKMPPSLVQGALFQGTSSESRLFAYGGTTYNANMSFEGFEPNNPMGGALWSYDTATKSWFEFSQDNVTYRPNWAAAAEAPELGLGFYLEGQVDIITTTIIGKEKLPVSGLAIVDTLNHNTRNVSTEAFTSNNPRRGGSLVYIPSVGSKGSLILLGGIVAGSPEQNDGWPDSEAQLSQVAMFDVSSLDSTPGSGSWYNQPATGDIPPPRVDFCLVEADAPDGSSHNIYMFGGREPFYNTPYDDVYVLSIPSFSWTLLYNGTNPRFGHTCHVTAKRQMLVVGGSLTPADFAIMNLPGNNLPHTNGTLNTTSAACDTTSNGVLLFDLTEGTWGTQYDPNGPDYAVPQKIVNTIGGTPTGGATVHSPSAGFAQPGLANVFKASMSSSSPSASASASSSSSSSNTGAIVGGVVGGVAGLLIIAVIAFFCLRRRSKARKARQSRGRDLPALEIGGDEKSPPPEMSPDSKQPLHHLHPAYRGGEHTAFRTELSGEDPVYEKGDHDMWEHQRRVFGNGNGVPGTLVHEKGNGVVHEAEGDSERSEADRYRDDFAKRGMGSPGMTVSDPSELDGSTVGARSEWGSPIKERSGVHEMDANR